AEALLEGDDATATAIDAYDAVFADDPAALQAHLGELKTDEERTQFLEAFKTRNDGMAFGEALDSVTSYRIFGNDKDYAVAKAMTLTAAECGGEDEREATITSAKLEASTDGLNDDEAFFGALEDPEEFADLPEEERKQKHAERKAALEKVWAQR